MSGFDLLAPVYDRLARFVFGNSIVDAQTCNLSSIPKTHGNVLIVGGGTGWILNDLYAQNPSVAVWYYDTSKKMIALAGTNSRFSEIHFVQDRSLTLPEVRFNAIITNFFFDMFSTDTTTELIRAIKPHMTASCVWLVAEFRTTHRFYQRLLLSMMYFFFRLFCRIEGSQLPSWEAAMRGLGMKRMKQELFYGGMIQSDVYRVAD